MILLASYFPAKLNFTDLSLAGKNFIKGKESILSPSI